MSSLIVLYVIIPLNATANPVAINDISWDLGGNILRLFFANLIIDGCLMLIPLFILSKLGFEKKISELWIFGVPLIAIWGAYIDTFYNITKTSLVIYQIPLISFLSCLLLIFITFIFIVHFLMNHRLITGMIIGTIAVIINGVFWIFLYTFIINNDSYFILHLTAWGALASFLLLILMIGYIIRKNRQKKYNDLISRPESKITKNLIKASISFIHTLFLFALAFFMMLYPV